MGLEEYARVISLEKDPLKLKFILAEDLYYPSFHEDIHGFTVKLPTPRFEDDFLTFLGYSFPNDVEGRKKIMQLFRASVFHLSGHTFSWRDSDYNDWREGKNEILTGFVTSLVEDTWINQYISAMYPDILVDLAFAGASMLTKLRDIENIQIQASRLMVSSMVYASDLGRFKEAVAQTFTDEDSIILPQKLEVADAVYTALLDHGPIIEVPSPPFAENLGSSSLFPTVKLNSSESFDRLMAECFEGLGGSRVVEEQFPSSRVGEAEALQAFESHLREKEKERKILTRYEQPESSSRFSSMGFPNKDYSEYLRVKARCKRISSKMTEVLMGALNEFTEDIRKKFGVLDLPDAIQVIASKSDRTDIFLRDEKSEQSFAWSIIVDASMSMRNVRDYALETAVILAESAGKVLLDMTSWSVFAFNDQFEIIKDFSEQYNSRVKARLGGLFFRGLSYMPDAIEIAGKALARRGEEFKVMMVISDGWPYGYQNIYSETMDIIRSLEAAGMAVIGIGAQSGRMEYLFDSHCTSYTLRQFVNKFSVRFYEACDKAL
jgi:hypothetical protein